MSKIKCFMLEPTGIEFRWLRRYTDAGPPCKDGNLHEACVPIEDGPYSSSEHYHPKDDPRWPTKCEACGYEFADFHTKQLFALQKYKAPDGNFYTLGGTILGPKAPPGAMWYADWLQEFWHGADGRCLMVMTPGGEWTIDGVCSNCTNPKDTEHKCWVRHGTPPNITVDKNGKTCQAGAGSIMAGKYHGFLRNGFLEEA